MLDCNTDDNSQLLYSALQDEWLLCSVITRGKEDTQVLKSKPFSAFFSMLFLGNTIQAVEGASVVTSRRAV